MLLSPCVIKAGPRSVWHSWTRWMEHPSDFCSVKKTKALSPSRNPHAIFMAPEKEPLNCLQALFDRDPVRRGHDMEWLSFSNSELTMRIQVPEMCTRHSFPEAASHFQCYCSQGRSLGQITAVPVGKVVSILHPGLPQ